MRFERSNITADADALIKFLEKVFIIEPAHYENNPAFAVIFSNLRKKITDQSLGQVLGLLKERNKIDLPTCHELMVRYSNVKNFSNNVLNLLLNKKIATADTFSSYIQAAAKEDKFEEVHKAFEEAKAEKRQYTKKTSFIVTVIDAVLEKRPDLAKQIFIENIKPRLNELNPLTIDLLKCKKNTIEVLESWLCKEKPGTYILVSDNEDKKTIKQENNKSIDNDAALLPKIKTLPSSNKETDVNHKPDNKKKRLMIKGSFLNETNHNKVLQASQLYENLGFLFTLSKNKKQAQKINSLMNKLDGNLIFKDKSEQDSLFNSNLNKDKIASFVPFASIFRTPLRDPKKEQNRLDKNPCLSVEPKNVPKI